MEGIDYSKMIPEPPEDLVEWVKKKGGLKTHFLIFRCGWETELETKKKKECFDVICSACETHFKARRNPKNKRKGKATGPAGTAEIEDCHFTACPHCGAKVYCRHVSGFTGKLANSEWPLVISKSGKNVIIAGYRVMLAVGKNGIESYQVDKYEAYVFTAEKAYRYAGWHSNGFGGLVFVKEWEPRKKCVDCFGSSKYMYYSQKNVFRGTAYENCKLHRYLQAEKQDAYPIGYMIFYHRRPQVENLLVQGYGNLVQEIIDEKSRGSGKGAIARINWKEKSPGKMLGLAKPDFCALKNKQLGSRDIADFKTIRVNNQNQTAEEICDIVRTFSGHIDEIGQYGKECMKIVRYCVKQSTKGSENPRSIFITWEDYIKMAQKLDCNLSDDSVRFPKVLKNAHDRAVMATKYNENQKLIEKFKTMYERLLPYCFEKDGLLIRPAASENELIVEGKILEHCVGGYGETHCNGKPIFFIRRANDPDIPYYTLNLDLKAKRIIQNHGYRNEALSPVPTEVTKFANYWLENVVKSVKKKKNKVTAA